MAGGRWPVAGTAKETRQEAGAAEQPRLGLANARWGAWRLRPLGNTQRWRRSVWSLVRSCATGWLEAGWSPGTGGLRSAGKIVTEQ